MRDAWHPQGGQQKVTQEHSMKEELEGIGSQSGLRAVEEHSAPVHRPTSHFLLTLEDLPRALLALSLLISLKNFQTCLPVLGLCNIRRFAPSACLPSYSR